MVTRANAQCMADATSADTLKTHPKHSCFYIDCNTFIGVITYRVYPYKGVYQSGRYVACAVWQTGLRLLQMPYLTKYLVR